MTTIFVGIDGNKEAIIASDTKVGISYIDLEGESQSIVGHGIQKIFQVKSNILVAGSGTLPHIQAGISLLPSKDKRTIDNVADSLIDYFENQPAPFRPHLFILGKDDFGFVFYELYGGDFDKAKKYIKKEYRAEKYDKVATFIPRKYIANEEKWIKNKLENDLSIKELAVETINFIGERHKGSDKRSNIWILPKEGSAFPIR